MDRQPGVFGGLAEAVEQRGLVGAEFGPLEGGGDPRVRGLEPTDF